MSRDILERFQRPLDTARLVSRFAVTLAGIGLMMRDLRRIRYGIEYPNVRRACRFSYKAALSTLHTGTHELSLHKDRTTSFRIHAFPPAGKAIDCLDCSSKWGGDDR